MKQLLYGLLLILSTAFVTHPPVNEKVSKAFSQIFPDAQNVTWRELNDFYEVNFNYNKIACNAKYDTNGNILSLRRDYYEKDIPFFIKAKLKEKYADKTVYGVTEITSAEGIMYKIILEDDKYWITVQCNSGGDLSKVQKLKKA